MLGGLVDSIDFFRYTTSDDGAGGFEETAEVVVSSSIRSRVTLLDTETQLKDLGYSGKNCWKIIAEPKGAMDNEGDLFCRLTPSTTSNKLSTSKVYRCLKAMKQENESGIFHHWTMWVQQEEDKDAS